MASLGSESASLGQVLAPKCSTKTPGAVVSARGAAQRGMDELTSLDPVDDAPGGLQGIAAEIAGERAIVADFFGADPTEVNGGDVLTAAFREVLKSIERVDALDYLIDGRASEFAEWTAEAEQQLEWTAVFNEYVKLVEGAVSEAMEDLECTEDELFHYARQWHAESGQAERLLARLLAFSDYHTFCKMMRANRECGGMSC